jgi:RimJ/RimL family protein N-acetyltransferase
MLTIRPIIDADLEVLFEFQADQESSQMATVASRDRESFLAHMTRNRANPDNFIYTILEDATVVGYLLSWEIEGERLLGYWVGRAYWGRGIAGKALSLFLDVLTSRPLVAHVASTNLGSVRVLERSGFTIISGETVEDKSFGTIELLKYQL